MPRPTGGVDLLDTIRAEIDERLAALRPVLAEYERLAAAAAELEAERAAARATRARRPRASDPCRQAILAALEHGSHTVPELVVVTAFPAAQIRAGLRALAADGLVARTRRGGAGAHALVSPAEA